MGQSLKSLTAMLSALFTLALAVTSPAFAELTLVSEQLRSGSGGWSRGILGNTSDPTDWSTAPFPDTPTNFTLADPSGGLQVKVTRRGSLSVFRNAPTGTTLNAAWSIEDFT